MGQKISQLPNATLVANADVFPLSQGNSTRKITFSKLRDALNININTSASLFHIRKRNGFIIVAGDKTPQEMVDVKLRVFRQQKGTIGEFFRNAATNVSLDGKNKFVSPEAAQTANFNFDLNFDTSYAQNELSSAPPRYNIQITGTRLIAGETIIKVMNSALEKEFFKILKFAGGNQLFIGYNRGSGRKGLFSFGSSVQQERYYTLWAALVNENKVVSNYVKIFAYYLGTGAVLNKYVFVQ